MVPDIWSAADTIFYHFGPYFALLPLHPPPPPPNNNPQSQNFEKMKKIPGDIIILHMCTIKMTVILCKIPEIWSTTDRIFCHSGPFFSPFTS